MSYLGQTTVKGQKWNSHRQHSPLDQTLSHRATSRAIASTVLPLSTMHTHPLSNWPGLPAQGMHSLLQDVGTNWPSLHGRTRVGPSLAPIPSGTALQ